MDGRGATRPFALRQTGIIGPRSPTLIRRHRTFPEGDAQVSLLAISIRFFRLLFAPLDLSFHRRPRQILH
jgi:hypothetical protein